ncbi:hypothetical protein [Peptoclostridium acidaminophilum]|nr:hypothetical protein [Peptoclostridium acidaminophilum]
MNISNKVSIIKNYIGGRGHMTEQVNCPVCGRRLFDKEGTVIGAISIKCPHCRKVARLQLEKQPMKRI